MPVATTMEASDSFARNLTALLVLPEHAMMCVPIMTVTAEIAYFLIIFPLRINTSWADLHYCGLN